MTNPNYPPGLRDSDLEGEPEIEDVAMREVEIAMPVEAMLVCGVVFFGSRDTARRLEAATKSALVAAEKQDRLARGDERQEARP